MNDRYLYRAKRTDNGEWVEGCLLIIDDSEYRIATSCLQGDVKELLNVCAYEVDQSTICQCTGLKDKNDKDIYEGDILRKSGYCDVRVEFERGQFCIKGADIVQYLNNTIYGSIRNFPVDEYEVIGNIFDNPELLEK